MPPPIRRIAAPHEELLRSHDANLLGLIPSRRLFGRRTPETFRIATEASRAANPRSTPKPVNFVVRLSPRCPERPTQRHRIRARRPRPAPRSPIRRAGRNPTGAAGVARPVHGFCEPVLVRADRPCLRVHDPSRANQGLGHAPAAGGPLLHPAGRPARRAVRRPRDLRDEGKLLRVLLHRGGYGLLHIPQGVWHATQNWGPVLGRICNFGTARFDPKDPDKSRIDPHSGAIPFDWSLRDG